VLNLSLLSVQFFNSTHPSIPVSATHHVSASVHTYIFSFRRDAHTVLTLTLSSSISPGPQFRTLGSHIPQFVVLLSSSFSLDLLHQPDPEEGVWDERGRRVFVGSGWVARGTEVCEGILNDEQYSRSFTEENLSSSRHGHCYDHPHDHHLTTPFRILTVRLSSLSTYSGAIAAVRCKFTYWSYGPTPVTFVTTSME
jgi:hypothetical protein